MKTKEIIKETINVIKEIGHQISESIYCDRNKQGHYSWGFLCAYGSTNRDGRHVVRVGPFTFGDTNH